MISFSFVNKNTNSQKYLLSKLQNEVYATGWNISLNSFFNLFSFEVTKFKIFLHKSYAFNYSQHNQTGTIYFYILKTSYILENNILIYMKTAIK